MAYHQKSSAKYGRYEQVNTYHSTTSLMHEEHLAHRIRRNRICRSKADALDHTRRQEIVEGLR